MCEKEAAAVALSMTRNEQDVPAGVMLPCVGSTRAAEQSTGVLKFERCSRGIFAQLVDVRGLGDLESGYGKSQNASDVNVCFSWLPSRSASCLPASYGVHQFSPGQTSQHRLPERTCIGTPRRRFRPQLKIQLMITQKRNSSTYS
ncbi:hypothetical protein [Oryza sativa Japonica Group]|uniref:Uncharacterized protein OJ1116_H09.1 n=1 Tax=Oryza sativa subsp. japonica TaxID=39947 RepID=Q8LJ23_ORYSJ|nr:hypothetical protein [Oryza sativa Japonica Group]